MSLRIRIIPKELHFNGCRRPWVVGILLWATCFGAGCSREARLERTSRWAVAQFEAPALSVDELHDMLAGGDNEIPLLVDARAEEEYVVSHLPGALHWDYVQSGEAPDEASGAARQGRPVVVYCSIGYRSGEAADRLRRELEAKGIDLSTITVYNLQGGIFEWASEGGQLAGGEKVHPYDAEWGKLLPPRLRAEVEQEE